MSAIHEKIKALLRLGQSPHEGEALNALAKAAELAAKHEIDLSDLRKEDEKRRIIHERLPSKAAVDRIERTIASLVGFIMPVKVLMHFDTSGSNHTITYIGTPDAIKQARWATFYLLEQVSNAIAKIRGPRKKLDWVLGFAQGVGTRTVSARQRFEIECPRASIILASAAIERDAYARTLGSFPSFEEKEVKSDPKAHAAGFAAGYTFEIPAASARGAHTPALS